MSCTLLALALAFMVFAGRGSDAGGRYLALGDSYTIGEAVPQQETFPFQLAKALRDAGVECTAPEVIATTGWTTSELQQGIREHPPQGRYALVTLLIGVNNQYRGQSLDAYKHEFADLLRQAIALAGDAPSGVVVLSIPDWGVTPFAEGRDRKRISAEIDRFNEAAKSICENRKVAFVDITPISRRADSDAALLASDGLHPSGKMYAEWVKAALPECKRALASR